MIRKLFGETDEQQFRYLKPRLIALGVGVALVLIGLLLIMLGVSFGEAIGSLGSGVCVIVLLIFGWAVVRALSGFATVGALLTNNIIVGVVLLVVFLIVGYLAGVVVAFVGLCRFLVLLKKRKGTK